MSVSRAFRRGLGFLAMLLLLQVSSGDALTRHRCAHHDALPAQPSEGHEHHDESAPAQHDSSGCTCVGTCTPSTVALAANAQPGEIAAVGMGELVHAAPPRLVLPATEKFLLPYSTAPPASL